MSINQIYKEVPTDQRLCEGCGNAIQRNFALLDKRLFHFRCLKRTRAKPTHQCLDCLSYLTPKGINKVTINGFTQQACGNCGSPNLRPLRKWQRRD